MNREVLLDVLVQADAVALDILDDELGEVTRRNYCDELLRELELQGYALARTKP